MKKLLIGFFILFSFLQSFGQTGNDSTKYVNYKYIYGQRMPRVWGDSVLAPPKDTVFSKFGLVIKNGVLYFGNNTKWTSVGASTSTFYDSTLMASSKTVVDSSNNKLRTIFRRNDSVFAFIGSSVVFQFKDSVGVGSGSTNFSVGGGYRLIVVGGTQVKSITKGAYILFDSTGTQVNIRVDSARLLDDVRTIVGDKVRDSTASAKALANTKVSSLRLGGTGNSTLFNTIGGTETTVGTVTGLDGFYNVSDADTVNIIYSNGKKQRVTYTGATAIKFTGFPNSGVIELQLYSGADGSYITNLPNAPSNEDYAMESGGMSKYVGTYDSVNNTFAWNFNLRTGAPVPDSLFTFLNGGHTMLAITAPLANKEGWVQACKTQLNFNYMMLFMDFWDATYRVRMDTMANILERNGMTFFPQITGSNPRADIDSMVKHAFMHGNLTRIRGKQTIAFYYGTPTCYNNLVADLPALGIPRDSINIICSPFYPYLVGSTWTYGGSYPTTQASVTQFNTIGYDGYIPFTVDRGGTDSSMRQNILNENQWLYEGCVATGKFMFLGISPNYMNFAVQQTSMSYSAMADVGNYALSQANYYNAIVGIDWTTLNDYGEESHIAPLPTESETGSGYGFWPPLGSAFVFGPALRAAPILDQKGAVQFFDIFYQAFRRHRTSLNITSSEVFIKTALHPRSVSVGSTIPSPWSTDPLYNSTWWNASEYAVVPAWVSNAAKFVMFDRIQMAAYLTTPGKLKINSTVSSTFPAGLAYFDIALTSGTPTISIMETDGTTVRKTGTNPLPITTTAYKGGFRSMFLKL